MSAKSSSFVVIGDIHGCAQTLRDLLGMLHPYNDRTFVFVGDYIDRGPDSKSVIDELISFSANHDCVFLRGNHEQMLLDTLDTADANLWLKYGGKQTLKSYGQTYTNINLPSQHFHFLRNTKLFLETEDYLMVHAGIPPGMTVRDAVKDPDVRDMMIWTREHIDSRTTAWEKKVVFGHTPMPEPVITESKIAIDTGCVYKYLPGLGNLTAVLLPEEKIISRPCSDHPEPY